MGRGFLAGIVCLTVSMPFVGCENDPELASAPLPRALPSPVEIQAQPDVSLGDPAFQPLPGASAEFGRLGGTVYQIEIPDAWNGRLVLYMHGFGELRPEARASPPAIRGYLIRHGFAWGASSFSSTSLIPGRAAAETAALWDHFVRQHGRPTRTYVTGQSMGGGASHMAAERYADRFDGALSLCGSAGQTAGLIVMADYFAAGAYVAGVTQAEFDRSGSIPALIRERIRPALADPTAHERFESIMLDLAGGPRAFDREGFRLEEDTNWSRAEILVSAQLAPNADRVYQLGPLSDVPSDEFNRAVIRLPVNDDLLRAFVAGNEITGDLQIPLLALHTTGDWQVPINQEQVRRRKVNAAGKGQLLVQRVVRDPGHCGFTTAEWDANLKALIAWVERAEKPDGEDVLTDDLRTLGKFGLAPRPGTPEADAVPGAVDRVTLRGNLTLDGAPFSARFLGARVRRNGLTAVCQYTLSQVVAGQYELQIMADAEASGCGAPGADILLWTAAGGPILYSRDTLQWPGDATVTTFDASFSSADPAGVSTPVTEFFGDVFDRGGEPLSGGTVVEAFAGDLLCGIGSVRRVGNFGGYILTVASPTAVPGCAEGALLTFRIDGGPALQTAYNDLGNHQLDLDVKWRFTCSGALGTEGPACDASCDAICR